MKKIRYDGMKLHKRNFFWKHSSHSGTNLPNCIDRSPDRFWCQISFHVGLLLSDLDSQIQFSCLLCPRELVLPLGNLILFVNKTKPWSGYTEAKYIKLKTKNQIPNFFGWHFNFFIHFWKRGTRKLFYSKKNLFLSRFVYKKLLNFHLHQQKIRINI